MSLFRRKKSRWQRMIEPVANRVDTRTAAKSGLIAAAGLVGLTAASAAVSALRHTKDS